MSVSNSVSLPSDNKVTFHRHYTQGHPYLKKKINEFNGSSCCSRSMCCLTGAQGMSWLTYAPLSVKPLCFDRVPLAYTYRYWPYGSEGCQTHGFQGFMTALASIHFIAAIAWDRYHQYCTSKSACQSVLLRVLLTD